VILVTGANGFLGSALIRRLERDGRPVVGSVRKSSDDKYIAVGDIGPNVDWCGALDGVDCVIHCAARVHVMNDTSADPLLMFREVNTGGTLNLAMQAAKKGVQRFIYLSSLKVNGELTGAGQYFSAEDVPAPTDPYAVSKLEAENGLRRLADQSGMDLVIVRPPLVYGPGVKANFATMIRWLSYGIPLPFGAVDTNRRSLIAVDNLVDLLVVCIDHPRAPGEVFLASDGEDVSTASLLRQLSYALGKPSRLWCISPNILSAVAKLLGREDFSRRLLGNLQVNMAKTYNVRGWYPPIDLAEGLRRAVKDLG
jgi:nucleoside-diphosphate-sugar epimerase